MRAASSRCRASAPRQLKVTLTNRQQTRDVDFVLLRRIIKTLVAELPIRHADLTVHLVSPEAITQLNEAFLQHAGATDVITFDYSDSPAGKPPSSPDLHGELFICVAEAVAQARRFRTDWPSEIVRYTVHGVLHLLGFDDLTPTARRKMKRAEDQRLRRLARRFRLTKLARRRRVP